MPVEEGVAHRKTGFSRKKKTGKNELRKKKEKSGSVPGKRGRKYNIGGYCIGGHWLERLR